MRGCDFDKQSRENNVKLQIQLFSASSNQILLLYTLQDVMLVYCTVGLFFPDTVYSCDKQNLLLS